MASRSVKRIKKEPNQSLVLDDREFDAQTQRYLEEIDHCQSELDHLNETSSEEILVIEKKMNKLRKPHYDRRGEFAKKIPSFWQQAFCNHPELGAMLLESEEDCFNYLNNMIVLESDDIKSGFRIEFYFSENPYFYNRVLVKEYKLWTGALPTTIATKIDWKPGMDLSRKVAPTLASQKRKFNAQTFFEWFSDSFDPSGDHIGDIIKDDFWQSPLQYFLTPDIEMKSSESEEEEAEEDESSNDADEKPIISVFDVPPADEEDPLK